LLLDDTLHQRHCRAQSLQCFQSAARAARDSLGRDHPNVAVSLVRIGFLLLQARQYNNAVITFQEALRIRQVHYGPHHALVANLYNNLGVCYMHLGQFAHGRDLLHQALTIQRTLLVAAQREQDGSTQEEKKESATTPQTANQSLELADTLFNIGGLALEWIRRQGPDVRHAQDAEEAFEESMEVRICFYVLLLILCIFTLSDLTNCYRLSSPAPEKCPGSQGSHGSTSKIVIGHGKVDSKAKITWTPKHCWECQAHQRKWQCQFSTGTTRSLWCIVVWPGCHE
jgi:tetratricopeptide (TPR) repeat protein